MLNLISKKILFSTVGSGSILGISLGNYFELFPLNLFNEEIKRIDYAGGGAQTLKVLLYLKKHLLVE